MDITKLYLVPGDYDCSIKSLFYEYLDTNYNYPMMKYGNLIEVYNNVGY